MWYACLSRRRFLPVKNCGFRAEISTTGAGGPWVLIPRGGGGGVKEILRYVEHAQDSRCCLCVFLFFLVPNTQHTEFTALTHEHFIV